MLVDLESQELLDLGITRPFAGTPFRAKTERMGYVPIADTRERDPYDPERDVAFFEPGRDFINVRAGMFAVFWPTDVHAPQAADGSPATVRKVVVKVAVDE